MAEFHVRIQVEPIAIGVRQLDRQQLANNLRRFAHAIEGGPSITAESEGGLVLDLGGKPVGSWSIE